MATIYLVGAVRGLVSEGERVATIIRNTGPDALAVSVSREGLAAMRGTDKQKIPGAMNPEEMAYMKGLSRFGEVVKPPPCFSATMGAAAELGLPLEPLDMDDEHYTAAYCKYISTMDMMRQGSARKRISQHVFRARTPENFVMEWDALVNRLEGYRRLERAREAWFAKVLARLAAKHDKVMAVIELERLEGVMAKLGDLGHAPEKV